MTTFARTTGDAVVVQRVTGGGLTAETWRFLAYAGGLRLVAYRREEREALHRPPERFYETRNGYPVDPAVARLAAEHYLARPLRVYDGPGHSAEVMHTHEPAAQAAG